MYKGFGNIVCDACGTNVASMDFIVVKGTSAVTHYCNEECQYNKPTKLFTLHASTWDNHHLVAVFSSQENAEKYVKKFRITDHPKIEEVEVNPMLDILNSDKTPYVVSCKKEGKIKFRTEEMYKFFQKDNFHFFSGTMFYQFLADNDKQAKEMAEAKRRELINLEWEEKE
jgi:hypothetical protein